MPLTDDTPETRRPLLWRLGLSVLLLAGLGLLWQDAPLREWLSTGRLAEATRWLRAHPAGPLVAAGAMAAGGCLMVPVTGMIVVVGLLFDWPIDFATALAGALAGAVLGYGIGRVLWRDALERLGGTRLNAISRGLANRGVLSVALVRLVPVAPFTLVNLVAGASHIRLRDYLLGSLLALAPGTFALTLFATSARRAIREPGWVTVLSVPVLAVVLWWAFRRLRRSLQSRAAAEQTLRRSVDGLRTGKAAEDAEVGREES